MLALSDDGAAYAYAFPNLAAGVLAACRAGRDVTLRDERHRLALPDAVAGRAGLSLSYSEAHRVAFAAFDGGAPSRSERISKPSSKTPKPAAERKKTHRERSERSERPRRARRAS